MPENRTVIIGVGPLSSQFTEKFVTALIAGPKGHGLVAVGIYDNSVAGPEIRKKIRKRTKRLKVDDITPKTSSRTIVPELSQLVELRRSIVPRKPQAVVLIIDAGFVKQKAIADVLIDHLRRESNQTAITAICFTDDDKEEGDRDAYESLKKYATPDAANNTSPMLEAAFIVRSNSPLVEAVGGQDTQNKLLGLSLAGIWSAPLYRRFNPPFEMQVQQIRQPGRKFIGMAVKTRGLEMKRPEKFFGRILYPILRHTTWRITTKDAVKCITDLCYSLLEDNPAEMTTVEPFKHLGVNVHELPISVNLIVPFKPKSKKFDEISQLVQQRLTRPRTLQPNDPGQQGYAPPASQFMPGGQHASAQQHPFESPPPPPTGPSYTVRQLSIVHGKGINLSTIPLIGTNGPEEKGKFKCQVCVLFSVDQQHISPPDTPTSPQAGAWGVNLANVAQDREG